MMDIFEEAIECALLENGPDACAADPMIIRETLAPYGDGAAPGGYRRRGPQDYDRPAARSRPSSRFPAGSRTAASPTPSPA
jgi:hypothetical protein